MSAMRPPGGADQDSLAHVSGGLHEPNLRLGEIAAPLLRIAEAPEGSDGDNRGAQGDEPGPPGTPREVFERVRA